MKVIIGIVRTVVAAAPDIGPFGTRSYQLSQNSDTLTLDLPDNEFASSLWMIADGMEVVSIPLDPGGLARFFDARDCRSESIICPECLAESFHPDDIREGWCAKCSDWTSGVDRLPRPAVHVASKPPLSKRECFFSVLVYGLGANIIILALFNPDPWFYPVIDIAMGLALGMAPPYLFLPRLIRKLKRRNTGQSHEPQ